MWSVKQAELKELKAFKAPPKCVAKAASIVYMFVKNDRKNLDWGNVSKFIGSVHCINEIKSFNYDVLYDLNV
jgi:hypothetical protein